jgi:hypothetical protein
MIYADGHPDVPLPEWEKFRKNFPRRLIREVVDRDRILLPDWFLPLARGCAFASDQLLFKCGHFVPTDELPGSYQANIDVFLKRNVADKQNVIATLAVRQYAGQDWWSIERYCEDRKYDDITDVLVHVFGSTPIFCSSYQSAMHVAEFCQANYLPSGLRWVTACPDNKDLAITFARKRRIEEDQARSRILPMTG